MKTYCLGVGCMKLCNSCEHDDNWKKLNELPNEERLKQQANMERIDESRCQITSGTLYIPKK